MKPINKLNNLISLTVNKKDINLKDIEDIISNIELKVTNWDTLVNCESSKITKLSSSWYQIFAIPELKKFDKLEEIKLEKFTIEKKETIKNISEVKNLKKLTLTGCNLEEIFIDFSELKFIQYINLRDNYISSKELKKLEALKDIKNLTIDLSTNSITDASYLLVLDPNTKINLNGNVNLSQDSKEKLKERFGNNVIF
ncbi:MAG: hypothetical protein ACLTBX_00595 [Clostridia bacterium]